MPRKSYRVKFAGGAGFDLAGIIDRPDQDQTEQHQNSSDIGPPPVAVFSHCFTCNKDLKAIVRISRGLAEQGIAVLRFDMTGLGGSDGDFSLTNFTTNAADLRAAIQFAGSEIGPVTTLIGHSFGGAVSLFIAGQPEVENPEAENPEARLAAVVTLAAPSDTKHLAELLVAKNAEIQSAGSGEVSIGGREWTIRRQMLEDFRQHDLPSVIPKIAVPTMLMHSPVDKTVSFDHAIRIMGLIQNSLDEAPPVSLVSLQGADHLLTSQPKDIDFVIATAAAFIRRYGS